MKVSLAGFVLGLAISIGSTCVSGVVGSLLDSSISAIATVLASAALVVVVMRAREHAATAAITVAVSLGATLAQAADLALFLPLAEASPPFYGAVRAKNFPVMVGATMVAGALVAFFVAQLFRRAQRALLPIAAAMIVATLALVTLGLRSFARPAPDAYAGLFRTSTLPPGGHLEIDGVVLDYHPTPRPAPLLGDRSCVVHVNGDDVAFPVVLDCPTLTVRSDTRSGFVVMLADHRPAVVLRWNVSGRALTAGALRGRLGTPHGWVWSALAALALAIAAWMAALRNRAITGAEADHEGRGWIRVAGVPRFAPELATVRAGPVVVADAAASPPTYRDDGAPKIFTATPGTLATLEHQRRARVASWACVAIAACVLGSAPLWIARLYGLL